MLDPFANANSPACDGCPALLLDEHLDRTEQGRMVKQVISLDFALQAGLTVTLHDITYPEFLLLRFLSDERNRFQEERQKAMDRGR